MTLPSPLPDIAAYRVRSERMSRLIRVARLGAIACWAAGIVAIGYFETSSPTEILLWALPISGVLIYLVASWMHDAAAQRVPLGAGQVAYKIDLLKGEADLQHHLAHLFREQGGCVFEFQVKAIFDVSEARKVGSAEEAARSRIQAALAASNSTN